MRGRRGMCCARHSLALDCTERGREGRKGRGALGATGGARSHLQAAGMRVVLVQAPHAVAASRVARRPLMRSVIEELRAPPKRIEEAAQLEKRDLRPLDHPFGRQHTPKWAWARGWAWKWAWSLVCATTAAERHDRCLGAGHVGGCGPVQMSTMSPAANCSSPCASTSCCTSKELRVGVRMTEAGRSPVRRASSDMLALVPVTT